MNTNLNKINSRGQQAGAALVVGLILLVALTLLALASMNTASLDLIMTGNEQTRARVFDAAEAGIETAYQNFAMFDTAGQHSSSGSTSNGVAYTYSVSPVNSGCEYTLGISGSATGSNGSGTGTSLTYYKAVYFTIQSTANAARGTAQNTQGVEYLITDNTVSDLATCNGGGSSSSGSGSSGSGGGLTP